MNKKMTRVIGIVAVLMLLMVACVGAASADVVNVTANADPGATGIVVGEMTGTLSQSVLTEDPANYYQIIAADNGIQVKYNDGTSVTDTKTIPVTGWSKCWVTCNYTTSESVPAVKDLGVLNSSEGSLSTSSIAYGSTVTGFALVLYDSNAKGIGVDDGFKIGGSVAISSPVAEPGQTVTITCTPDEGKVLKYVYVYGINSETEIETTAIGNNSYTFDMPSDDVDITGEFGAAGNDVTVTNPESGGSFSVSPSTGVTEDTEVTITVAPDTGYGLKTLSATYTDSESHQQSLTLEAGTAANTYTFDMPAYAVTVTGTFDTVRTITFNPNNGQGTIQTHEFVNGKETAIPNMNPVFSWTGHTQTGWNTKSDGTGTQINGVNGSYSASGDATLYATWTSGSTTDVKMILSSNYTFKIPSEVILSNELNGKVGAEIGITQGSVTTESPIVMRLNTAAVAEASADYDTFDVTGTEGRVSGKYADYQLNTYNAATLATSAKVKSVTGNQVIGGSSTAKNNIVLSCAATESASNSGYLAFETKSLPTFAGTYSDQLTFVVDVEDTVNVTFGTTNAAWKVTGTETVPGTVSFVNGDTINYVINDPATTATVTIKRGDTVVGTYTATALSGNVTGFTYTVGTTENPLTSGTPYTVSASGTLEATTAAASGITISISPATAASDVTYTGDTVFTVKPGTTLVYAYTTEDSTHTATISYVKPDESVGTFSYTYPKSYGVNSAYLSNGVGDYLLNSSFSTPVYDGWTTIKILPETTKTAVLFTNVNNITTDSEDSFDVTGGKVNGYYVTAKNNDANSLKFELDGTSKIMTVKALDSSGNTLTGEFTITEVNSFDTNNWFTVDGVITITNNANEWIITAGKKLDRYYDE